MQEEHFGTPTVVGYQQYTEAQLQPPYRQSLSSFDPRAQPTPTGRMFPVDRPPEPASMRVPGCTAVFIGGLTNCGITDEFVGTVFEQCGPIEKVSLFPLSELRPEAFTSAPGRSDDELWRGLHALHRDTAQEHLYAMVKFSFVEGPLRAVRFNGATLDVIFPPPNSTAARGPQRLSFLLTVDFVNDAELHFFVPGLEPPTNASSQPLMQVPEPECRPVEFADRDFRRQSAPLAAPVMQASFQQQSAPAPPAASIAPPAKPPGAGVRTYSPSQPTDSETDLKQEAGATRRAAIQAAELEGVYRPGMTLQTPNRQVLADLCDYKPLLVTEFAPRPFSHADLNILLSGLQCMRRFLSHNWRCKDMQGPCLLGA